MIESCGGGAVSLHFAINQSVQLPNLCLEPIGIVTAKKGICYYYP